MKTLLTLTMLALALVLVGCAASEPTNAAAETASGQEAGADRAGRGGSGEVVELAGSTAQVQNQQSQVAVTWTVSTTFTQQVDADLAAVTVGACVVVRSEDDADGDDVAATTVQVTEATDGSCARGAGTQARERPEGGDRTPPADAPDQAADGAGRGGAGVIGEVTAVSATGFTVAAQQPGSEDVSDVTVTVSATTTMSATADATASDVAVGRCITSDGEADETGAITATSIAISDSVDGECAAGAGGQRPRAAA